MGRRTKAGLWLIVVACAAFSTWWVFSLREGTAARVAQWLNTSCSSSAAVASICTDCPEVTTATISLPVTGAAHAEPAGRRFADDAREFKSIECGGLGGSIDFYRFSSTAARVRAVAGYPYLHRRVFCSSGAEVLVNELLGFRDPFVEYCHRLRFQLYRPSKRNT
jgi:hypothetical protein